MADKKPIKLPRPPALTGVDSKGAFDIRNDKRSKKYVNTLKGQGVKQTKNNLSNVSTNQQSLLSITTSTESGTYQSTGTGKSKPPDHREVKAAAKIVIKDVLGITHIYEPGTSREAILDDINGPDWMSRDLWDIGEGLIQGLAIEGTGGAAIVFIGGKAVGTVAAWKRGLLVAKASAATLRYKFDPSQSHGDPNGWGYSALLGIGSTFGKFGNVDDALGGLVSKTSILYKLTHTSHTWHHTTSAFSLKGQFTKQFFGIGTKGGRFLPGGGRALAGQTNFGGLNLTFNNIYFNIGADNIEKQWLTVTSMYKGKIGLSPYQYELLNKAEHHGYLNDYYSSRVDKTIEEAELKIGLYGKAEDRLRERGQQKNEGNFLNKGKDNYRNFTQYQSELGSEDFQHVQTTNWQALDKLTNSKTLLGKLEAAGGLLAAAGTTAFYGTRGIIQKADALLLTGLETVATPILRINADAYMYAYVMATVPDSNQGHIQKEKKTEPDGSTTHTYKSTYQFPKPSSNLNKMASESTSVVKVTSIRKEELQLGVEEQKETKKFYDERREVQTKINKKIAEHSGYFIAKPWTKVEVDELRQLNTENKQLTLLINGTLEHMKSGDDHKSSGRITQDPKTKKNLKLH
jgi:hypothetical protein